MKRISIYCLLMFCALLTASAQQTKQLVILHTSDTHSRIEPIDLHAADPYAGAGGVVRRATFLKDFRTKNPDVLLFDCGDISQGTPYYNLFRGEVEVRMMNLMGYDAMTIGNHEFDFGWIIWRVCSVWPTFRWYVPITMSPEQFLRNW